MFEFLFKRSFMENLSRLVDLTEMDFDTKDESLNSEDVIENVEYNVSEDELAFLPEPSNEGHYIDDVKFLVSEESESNTKTLPPSSDWFGGSLDWNLKRIEKEKIVVQLNRKI